MTIGGRTGLHIKCDVEIQRLNECLQEAQETTDRVCKFANIGLADLRKKRNQVVAERDAAQKELADLHEHKFRLYATIEGLEETIDGMRREGCASIGLVENIFNGLTTPPVIGQGASLRIQQEMVDACANLLVEATACDHKERAESVEKQLRLIMEEAEGMPEEGLAQAIERVEALEIMLERVLSILPAVVPGGKRVFTVSANEQIKIYTEAFRLLYKLT